MSTTTNNQQQQQERNALLKQLTMLVPADMSQHLPSFFSTCVDPKVKLKQISAYSKINPVDARNQFMTWVRQNKQQSNNNNNNNSQQQNNNKKNNNNNQNNKGAAAGALLPPPSSSAGGIRQRGETNNNNETLVGTSKALEREFTRTELTEEMLRPLSVLKLAKAHILKKSKEAPEFRQNPVEGLSWLFRQLKGMRQDIRAQNLDHHLMSSTATLTNNNNNDTNNNNNNSDLEFTVGVYQLHATVSLHLGDLSEYIQCQAQIKTLHDAKNLSTSPLEVEEFTIYRLLELALAGQDDVVTGEIRTLASLSSKMESKVSVCENFVNRYSRSGNDSFEEEALSALFGSGGNTTSSGNSNTIVPEYNFLRDQIFSSDDAATTVSSSSKNNNNIKHSRKILLILFLALNERYSKRVSDFMMTTTNNNSSHQSHGGQQSSLSSTTMILESWVANKLLSSCNVNFTTTLQSRTNMNNIRETQITKKLISANATLACLVKRPSVKLLLECIALLQRGDGSSFVQSILKLDRLMSSNHAEMNLHNNRSTSYYVAHEQPLHSLLHLVKIFLQKIRIRWLFNFCKAIKGTDEMNIVILKKILGFADDNQKQKQENNNIDEAIHKSLGVVSKFHSHQLQQKQQQRFIHSTNKFYEESNNNNNNNQQYDSAAHQNFCQLFDEIKYRPGGKQMQLSGSEFMSATRNFDFAAMSSAVVNYTFDLGVGTLNRLPGTPVVAEN